MIVRKYISLAELGAGRSCRIMEPASGRGLTRRLEEMGIRAGKRAVKISGMPLRGPVVVQVGGTRIALGHGMARKIMVEV
ncbi:MAG: FeoA family protein [Candidatus Euphemobacter frigidus]|nr:FeoA family protein [Candidatus Euphemobacter frigidus]MDP8276746.1 FeoA family protein [Candidatus Euphemobacter frigidus]